MTDYYLKATDEQALYDALCAAGLAINLIDADSNVVGRQIDPSISLDVIGTIYEPTGVMIEVDDVLTPQMAPIEGFHANLRGELTEEQAAALPIIPNPNNPVRVWA